MKDKLVLVVHFKCAVQGDKHHVVKGTLSQIEDEIEDLHEQYDCKSYTVYGLHAKGKKGSEGVNWFDEEN